MSPFSDAWLDQLDRMSREDALVWVQHHLEASIRCRNNYEVQILAGEVTPGLLHVWCIDNNNIIRFKRLLCEIDSEGEL